MAEAAVHLDTNFLIRATFGDERVLGACERWLGEGAKLGVSSIAWFECVCGPLREAARARVARLVTGGIVIFGAASAERAAKIFNVVGRKCSGRRDCMIAAAAMEAGASLATLNGPHFAPFVEQGLQLAAL